jgi:hypothetical protein
LFVTVPTVLPGALPTPRVTSVTLAMPDVSTFVGLCVVFGVVFGVVALVSTDPDAVEVLVPPTPAWQAAAPSVTPELV